MAPPGRPTSLPTRSYARAATAALLNASMLAAGYVYLRRWGWFVGWLTVTTSVFVLAALGDYGTSPRLPATVLGIWLAWAVLHGWFAGLRGPASRVTPNVPTRPVTLGGVTIPGEPDRRDRHSDPRTSGGARLLPIGFAVVLMIGVASGFLVYRSAAEDTYAAAAAAHAEGDCAEAVDGYQSLNRRYWMSFTSHAQAANREAHACDLLLSAQTQHDDAQFADAIDLYENYLAGGGDVALWDGITDTLLQARLDLADDLASEAMAGSGRRYLPFDRAFTAYEEVLAEEPDDATVDTVHDAVEALYEAATPNVGSDHCAAVDELDMVTQVRAEIAEPLVERAQAAQPEALLECAEELFDEEKYDDAEDTLATLLDDFPDASQADRASSLLGQVEDAIAQAEAEQAEQDIIDTIDQITSGSTGDLPPPPASGSAPGGSTSVAIENSSGRELEVMYTGPETDRAVIDVGESTTLNLTPGTYRIVARVSGGGVIPYSGSWNLASGTAYSEVYYIL